jgi:succinate dehydrogenase / fumarate reductase flavoprotein subunit
MQRVMADKCSVFRNRKALQEALEDIRQLKQRYRSMSVTSKGRRFNYELEEALELGNMLQTAEVIVFSALQREESRGAHFRSDFPERNDDKWLKHTLVYATTEDLRVSYKPVSITRFPPQKRRY